MIDTTLAATIAFVALGVNFFGAILLLLLNAGSRSLRWYLPFHFCVLLWLLAQGANLLWPGRGWEGLHAFAIAMLPLFFFIFGVMDSSERPAWHVFVLLALLAPLIPIVMDSIYGGSANDLADILGRAWSVAGWIGGSLILWLSGRRQARQAPEHMNMRKKIILLAFVLIAPISVVSAILVHGEWFVLMVVPVITIMIMILIFYGVTRLQFYDIEVRARRSGDIAAETVETGRLAVLGELAATIAHEVRNPLTGVRSLAQRLAHEELPEEKRRNYANVILQETGRVESLVSNLLEISRRGSRERSAAPTNIPLSTLFADLSLLVATRAANKQVVINASTEGDPSVNAPREAVTQAVLNLLLNAVAHAPARSTIDLWARRQDEGTDIIVRDHGTGVPAEDRTRIFEPFFSTRADGTGLGLSVVRHLAREHGWRVSVDDAPGGGAEFHLVIP